MWKFIARIILRQRWVLLGIIGVLLLVMGYFAKNVQMSYDLAQMLPSSDSSFIEYNKFKEKFGEDGNVFVVGVTDPDFFTLEHFNAWYDLGLTIKAMDGVEEVVSVARCINLYKNDSTKKFEFRPVFAQKPNSQTELDSLKQIVNSLPFYRGLTLNPETHTYLMAITLNKKKLNNKSRVQLVNQIAKKIDIYSTKEKVTTHCSGLPYIRTVMSEKIKSELKLFVILSLIIAALILTGLFRSFRAVLASLVVVAVSVVFTMGIMGIFGYKITILTAIIPSLLIIIGIENCIFLVNKYHYEYKNHGNKVKALSRIIQRIGTATFLTNATTAAGFATFIITSTKILQEFGVIATISIMMEFLLSIVIIPIFFSLMPPPKEKHVKHVDNKYFVKILTSIIHIISNRRRSVYVVTVILVVVGIYGMTLMKTSGKVVDDLPESNSIYKDLKYFEKNVKGIMPFEISIDTKKKNGVMQLKTIKKINELQDEILKLPYFSQPLSVAEMVKFARQAYYNGKESKYALPGQEESAFILSYMPGKNDVNEKVKNNNPLHAFIDSTKQCTRISFQMADVGMKEMNEILSVLKPKVDSIFDKSKYNVTITGNSVVYTKGTEFLIWNLIQSVCLAILLISAIMALLFSSFRMILISMIPNLIPLILVAGMMGYVGIPVKPSTIIVFSIALGIAVDNAIHFLSRYRYELRLRNWDIGESTKIALREAGVSMLSSSLVLVCGFSIFIISGFGGTQALGLLISITLFLSLFCNAILIPSLLLSLDKMVTNKSFSKPMVEIFDEDDTDDADDEVSEESDKKKELLFKEE